MSNKVTLPQLEVYSMFAGIGGIDLGLENTGHYKTIALAETDKFANKVLEHHWPNIPNYGDVTSIDYDTWVDKPDVIAAGFPCQDISVAGKQSGIKQGNRSGLFYEVIRAISNLRPRYVLLENVAAITSSNGGGDGRRVVGELTALGYDCEWAIIRASDVGAPHKRARWFCIGWERLGYAEHDGRDACAFTGSDGSPDEQVSEGQEQSRESSRASSARTIPELAYTNSAGSPRYGELVEGSPEKYSSESRVFHSPRKHWYWNSGVPNQHGRLVEPSICLLANGVPKRVDKLRALGNAVVPQVAQHVGECLWNFHKTRRII